MSSPQKMAQKQKARAAAQQQHDQIVALPAIAANKKADAAQFKAGMMGGSQASMQPPAVGPNMQPIQGAA